jgi:hypothetical protein
MKLSEVGEEKPRTMKLSEVETAPPSQMEETKEFFRGAALPAFGVMQSIPYEPIQKFATEKVQQIEARPEYISPGGTIGARSLGKFIGSAGLATLPVSKLLSRTAPLSAGARLGSSVAGGAATGAVTSGLMQEAPTMEQIRPVKEEAAITGGTIGALLGGVPSLAQAAKSGYDKLSNTLNRAFGGDVKRLAEELRRYASTQSGAEANMARKLADDAAKRVTAAEKESGAAVKRAGIAEAEAGRQAEIGAQKLGIMPGTVGQVEAGAMRAIPATEQSIGQTIKDTANTIYKKLRDARSERVTENKRQAFSDAFEKESDNKNVIQTQAYKNLLQQIDTELENPVTGLSNVEVGSLRQQLESLRRYLDPTQVVGGTVIGRKISFESLENLRRFLNDRSYGLPAEGFDAISQQQAGTIAKQVEKVMEEFSPGIRKYIDQYRKDSEPLRVFATKIGKALTSQQLTGSGSNYATVAAQSIPGKVFKDRESYQSLVDALGGDTKFASKEAAKYFTNEIEKLAGNPDKIRTFIRDNREMLNVTGNKPLLENYFAQVQQASGRAKFAGEKAKTETQLAQERTAAAKAESGAAETQMRVARDFETLQSNLITARNPQEIATATDAFARKALAEGRINQAKYREIMDQSNRILSAVDDSRIAKEEINRMVPRVLGYGVLGAAGVYGVRSMER